MHHLKKLGWLTLSLFLLSSCGESSSTGGRPEPSPEIKALQEQRIETFREMVAMAEAKFADGQGSSSNLLEAQRKLLVAQLDADSDPAERTQLREEIVENLMQFEVQVEAEILSGGAPHSNLLEVRAARLQAEIELARERE